MKNRITKLLALLMALAIVFSLGACGRDDSETTTAEQANAQETTAQQTTAVEVRLTETEIRLALGEAQSQWDGSAANLTDEMKAAVAMYYKTSGKPVQFKDDGFYFVEDEGATVSNETTLTGETTADGQTTTAAVNKDPSTNAEILAAYTAVMDKAKTDKPGYTYKEYQALPKEQQKMEGKVIGALLPLAEMFMTKGDPQVRGKTGDMMDFPVKKATKGCLLTNAAAVKTANYEKLANGNVRITIVLNNELNPEPYKSGQPKASSNTGNMFFVLGKSDIDNELTNNSTVKRVIKEANYSLTYRDCKATLEFNPETQKIVSLKHYVSAFIDMSGKIIILGDQKGTAVLEMFYEAYDFQY